MEKMIFKFTQSAFFVIFFMMMISITVSADVISGSCGTEGDNLTYSYDTETEVLNISGIGEMNNFGYINCAPPWSDYRPFVKSINIGDGVTSIGSFAFASFENLTSVMIPDSVKSIGSIAFSDCCNLTDVTIPESVTSIGGSAFGGCNNLKSIIIPESVTNIGYYAFDNCYNLENITINGVVTSIGECAFRYTGYYNHEYGWGKDNGVYIGEHLIVAHGGFEGVFEIKPGTKTIADAAFYGCYNITSIVIPDSVTNIGTRLFDGCDSLKSIKISGNNANYCDIDGVLFTKDKTELIAYPAGSLEVYHIPDCVTSIAEYAFENCDKLTSVTIPNSVTSIDERAFYFCDNISNIKIKSKNITINADAFVYCNNLKTIYLYKNSDADGFFEASDYTLVYYDDIEHGDVNCDGYIDFNDAVLLNRYLAKWNVAVDKDAADCNADGKINSKDAVLLTQYLEKWNVTLG